MNEVGHVLWESFYWPGGVLVGNLLASVIWSSVFDWRLRVHHRRTEASIKDHVTKETSK